MCNTDAHAEDASRLGEALSQNRRQRHANVPRVAVLLLGKLAEKISCGRPVTWLTDQNASLTRSKVEVCAFFTSIEGIQLNVRRPSPLQQIKTVSTSIDPDFPSLTQKV